ncbi:hypothetical protein GALMADRAFT_254278 [Galerina marginata CBS 339.88]|uniref:Uncharacterized protein n=1 Tax=Galerina marginata (strain CBS 339.88) TaxID=685588 RepID=A0A067STS2_GALM3|nr:hypothetical protein GALMADRAFT_254278 [Galerina marginata CBS 339.88]
MNPSNPSLGPISYSGHNANSSPLPGQYPSSGRYETDKVSELTAQNAHYRRHPQTYQLPADPPRPRAPSLVEPPGQNRTAAQNQYLPHGPPLTQQPPHRYPQGGHAMQPAGPSMITSPRQRIPSSVEAARLPPSVQNQYIPQGSSQFPPTQLPQRPPQQLQSFRPPSSDSQRPQPTRAPSPPPLHYRYDEGHPTFPVNTMSKNVPPPQPSHPVYSPGPPPGNQPPQPSQLSPSRDHRRSSGGSSAPLPPSSHNNVSPTGTTSAPAPAPPPQPARNPSHGQVQRPLTSPEPLVLASADAALTPLRTGIESLWNTTVGNVRGAMVKMHDDCTKLLGSERQKNNSLMVSMGEIESQLQAALSEVRSLRKEKESLKAGMDVGDVVKDKLKHEVEKWKRDNEAIKGANERLKRDREVLKISLDKASLIIAGFHADFAKLRAEKERLEIEHGVMANFANNAATSQRAGQQGDREVVDSMTSVLTAVSEQVTRQMEVKVNAILDEMQEQKNLRIQAEQKSAEALRQLEEAKRLAEPSFFYRRPTPCDRPESSSSTSSPQFRRTSQPRMDTTSHYSRPSTADNQTSHSRRNSMSSPQILSDAPALTRLSISSHSSTTTHVDMSSSPSQMKGPFQYEAHQEEVDPTSPVIPRERFQSSPLTGPEDRRQPQYSPSPYIPRPPSPTRKRTRSEYEQDQQGTTAGPSQPSSAAPSRASSPPRFKVKTEAFDDPSCIPVTPGDCPDPVPTSVTASHSTSTEEGEIRHMQPKVEPTPAEARQEYEEGEVVDPVEPQSASSTSNPGMNQVPKRHFKLGINHIDLLYKDETSWLVCRMCLTRRQAASASDRRTRAVGNINVERFPKSASWSDLVQHCQNEHPKACQDLEKLNPSQIAEKKQRMLYGSTTTFMR